MERVVPGAGPTTRIVALGNAMAPDTGLHYGASDLQAVLPLFVERYRRFMQLAEPDIDQLYPTSAGVRQAGPWTDLASVERVVVPVAWRLGLGDPAVEFKGRGVRTSRRPDALPRAYVAHAVRIEPDMDGAARAMAEGPDDRRLVPVVEPGDTAGPWESLAGVSASAAPLTPARIERYDPTEVVIDVHGSGPGLLVLTDTFYPGWEAEIDGEEAPIVPANLAFRGVPIGAGAGEVVFRYRPSSLRAGLLIAGTGAVVLLGLLGLHFRDRLSRGSTA
jgi:hypothetical protein